MAILEAPVQQRSEPVSQAEEEKEEGEKAEDKEKEQEKEKEGHEHTVQTEECMESLDGDETAEGWQETAEGWQEKVKADKQPEMDTSEEEEEKEGKRVSTWAGSSAGALEAQDAEQRPWKTAKVARPYLHTSKK